MQTLLDILKDNLPDGAELRNEKETTNRFKYDFYYKRKTIKGEIGKTVAPGHEKVFVIKAIATCISQIYLADGNLDDGMYWLKIATNGPNPEEK